MQTTTEEFNKKHKTDEERRKSYTEAKARSKSQRPEVAVRACDRLLMYINRIETVKAGCKVLDLGCGIGRLSVELAARGYEVYGTDINPDFIEMAQDKAEKRGISAKFMTAAGEELPFDNQFFDICIVNSVLEHVENWKKTIDEAARILKPGGIAYLATGNALYPIPHEIKHIPCLGYIPYRLRKRIINFVVKRFPKLVGYSVTPGQYWFTHTGLRKVLRKVGFKQTWDIFDLTSRQDIPPRFRFAGWLLPLIKKIPHPYLREVMFFSLPDVRLFCRKG